MDLYVKTDKLISSDIGQKIKATRLEMNLTQNDLSSRSGISVRTISDIEKGGNYTVLSLIALLRALSLLDYLDQFFKEKKITPLEYLKLAESSQKRKRAVGREIKTEEEDLGW